MRFSCLRATSLLLVHFLRLSNAFVPTRIALYRRDSISNRGKRHVLPLSSRTNIRISQAASTRAAEALLPNNEKETSFTPDFYHPNAIQPQTETLTESAMHFVTFSLRMYFHQLRRRRLLQLRKQIHKYKRKPNLWRKTLTEQYNNLVQLADYRSSLAIPSFGFLVLGALMTSIVPHYEAACIQLVATMDTNKSRILRALLGLAIASTLGAILTGLRGSLFWIGGARINHTIRIKLHRALLLQEAAFFDTNEVGYLLSRLAVDVDRVGDVISFHVNIVCRRLAQFLFGTIYLFRISPFLAVMALLGIGVVGWVSKVYGSFNRDLSQRVQRAMAESSALAETSFSLSETIRAFNGVKIESEKFESSQGTALQLEEVQAWGYGAHKFVSDTVQYALYVALLLLCWRMGIAGQLPASQVTAFLYYTNFVLESSNEVGDQWAKIQGAVGASSSVFELIQRVPAIRDAIRSGLETSSHVNGELHPIVQVNNITVHYGTMEIPAINGVSLSVDKGERVAIVGRSGSGKSSLLRSILRFYDPVQGNIQINGIDLRNFTRQEMASQMAIVSQEPDLFPLTLLDNVLYGIDKDTVDPRTGKPCYSYQLRQRAEKALQLAGLQLSPSNDLNLGLDSRVGEGGRTLSGGQRQRVAIARALTRNPTILLLDEPTSALDTVSETKVIKALQSATDHCQCTILVTHRLGAIRSLNVNRVIVMDSGKIVESGDPEELLLKENSMYGNLAREQGIVGQLTVHK